MKLRFGTLGKIGQNRLRLRVLQERPLSADELVRTGRQEEHIALPHQHLSTVLIQHDA